MGTGAHLRFKGLEPAVCLRNHLRIHGQCVAQTAVKLPKKLGTHFTYQLRMDSWVDWSTTCLNLLLKEITVKQRPHEDSNPQHAD